MRAFQVMSHLSEVLQTSTGNFNQRWIEEIPCIQQGAIVEDADHRWERQPGLNRREHILLSRSYPVKVCLEKNWVYSTEECHSIRKKSC